MGSYRFEMTPFLQQAARFYFKAGDISRLCFVFPNKRAESFFAKFLAQEVASGSDVPVLAPESRTISDFFYELSSARRTDRIMLINELYGCYTRLNSKAEPLDDFLFWGGVLLSDFDDVDKYLVDARSLFTNVSEFKGMQDDFSYLSEEQKEAVSRFLSHFDKDNRGGREYKDRFLLIWDILYPLYRDFNEVLREKGLSYEGMVYRELADRLSRESAADILETAFPETDKFVFVGLNALNECEKKVMGSMRNAGLADFLWDYGSPEIKDPRNRSSFFLSSNIREFPGPAGFVPDPDGFTRPEINVVSVPSSTGQAKLLPSILSRFPSPGLETAVVLPDENLLLPVLNSIPSGIQDINVTMGYPMGNSAIATLMAQTAQLQLHIREKDGGIYFYHKPVWAILTNGIFKSVLSEEERQAVASLKKGGKYYIPSGDFGDGELMGLVFRKAGDAASYLREIIIALALKLKGDDSMGMELDFCKEYLRAVTRLESLSLDVTQATWFRLLGQMVSTESVPFRGEPLKGLQIMGPLETRVLDFENLVILSCNEGVFPRHSSSSSFIPPELRKGFGLPTYEYQDSVWAYYFYRLIQRAGKVWMLYDSRAEGVRSGEESRYIKQLELHFGFKINRFSYKDTITSSSIEEEIPKTEEDIAVLKEGHLSASALQNYLSCQAKFYFHSVKGLRAEDDISESLDSGMIGNVLHKTMCELYSGAASITRSHIEGLLKDHDRIKGTVSKYIREELRTFEVNGRNIIFQDLICKYAERILKKDLELLHRKGLDSFRIIGLEQKRSLNWGGFRFVGTIDRLDSFEPGKIRVVDYKTGRVTDEEVYQDPEKVSDLQKKLFGGSNKDRPKIIIQLFLYDKMVKDDPALKGKTILNSIYQTSRLFTEDIPESEMGEEITDMVEAGIQEKLSEIEDLSMPWKRTVDKETCSWCNFRLICGR